MPPVGIGALHPKGLEAFGHNLLLTLRLGFLLRIPWLVNFAVRRVFGFMPFTPVANITGQPAMSVPLYWNAAGIPIGAHVSARFGDEATLFRVAAELERARPWFARKPPILSNGEA
jgi:amidase